MKIIGQPSKGLFGYNISGTKDSLQFLKKHIHVIGIILSSNKNILVLESIFINEE